MSSHSHIFFFLPHPVILPLLTVLLQNLIFAWFLKTISQGLVRAAGCKCFGIPATCISLSKTLFSIFAFSVASKSGGTDLMDPQNSNLYLKNSTQKTWSAPHTKCKALPRSRRRSNSSQTHRGALLFSWFRTSEDTPQNAFEREKVCPAPQTKLTGLQTTKGIYH